jgi:NAD(P)-dependent dehydrogenase (short-subunit alcohol dehydrogenase family)
MLKEKLSLAGKRGIITGASRGLGRAMAEGLAEMGADLLIIARDTKQLGQTAFDLSRHGRRIISFPADVADDDALRAAVEKIAADLGGLDFVFCNAGVIRRGPAENLSIEDFDEVFRVNVHSCFVLGQLAAQVMIAQGTGGSVVMTDSVVSHSGGQNIAAYASSKGAIRMLVKAMANDLGRYGIRVNAIGPGYFETDMTRALREDPSRFEALRSRMALGRWGRPEDLAGIAVFLAGDASAYLTGQTIYVDGGFTSM